MSSMFEPDQKRRKVLNDIHLTTDLDLGKMPEDDDDVTEPMSYKELVDVKYKECYACENMHARSLEENENYRRMMELYTENSANICKDAIFKKIHEFYNLIIVPDLKDIHDEGDPPIMNWTLESIREHFEAHTNYPTDEILFQSRLKKAIRNKLAENLIEKKNNGTLKFNHKNLDIMMKLDKMIIDLMKTKKDINSMVGYSKELDY